MCTSGRPSIQAIRYTRAHTRTRDSRVARASALIGVAAPSRRRAARSRNHMQTHGTGEVMRQPLRRRTLLSTFQWTRSAGLLNYFWSFMSSYFNCLNAVISILDLPYKMHFLCSTRMLAGHFWNVAKCISSYHSQIWTKQHSLMNKDALRTNSLQLDVLPRSNVQTAWWL